MSGDREGFCMSNFMISKIYYKLYLIILRIKSGVKKTYITSSLYCDNIIKILYMVKEYVVVMRQFRE
jgi:hypothetical protein